MYVVPQQYFIGKESLDADENHFYDFFRKIDKYSSLTEPNKKIEDYALLSNSNFGFYIQFENDGHYTPNERTELNKIILSLFVSFLTSSWHENAFNIAFNEKIEGIKEVKKIFAWVYLPSEKVIRYYNKNCVLKANIKLPLEENKIADLSVTNLLYFGFSHSEFDLDYLSSAIETQSSIGIEETICLVKLIPKSKYSPSEIKDLCKRYKTFELFKEIEAIQPSDNDEGKLMVMAQNFLVQTALKDSDTNTFFEKNLEPHLDVLTSSSLSGLRKMIFKRVLDEYKHNEKHETLSSPESKPQSAQKPEEPVIIRQDYNELIKQKFFAVFAQYTGLKQDFLGRLSQSLSKDQYDTLCGLCEQYKADLTGLQSALNKVNVKKLTAENTLTFESIEAHVNREMSLNEIKNATAQIINLIAKNNSNYPLWKQENPSGLTMFLAPLKRKKQVLIGTVLFFLIAGVAAYAWQNKERQIAETVEPEPLMLEKYQDNGLYGFKLGEEIIIPASFNSATDFEDGKAKVSTADSVFYINEEGKMIVFIGLVNEIYEIELIEETPQSISQISSSEITTNNNLSNQNATSSPARASNDVWNGSNMYASESVVEREYQKLLLKYTNMKIPSIEEKRFIDQIADATLKEIYKKKIDKHNSAIVGQVSPTLPSSSMGSNQSPQVLTPDEQRKFNQLKSDALTLISYRNSELDPSRKKTYEVTIERKLGEALKLKPDDPEILNLLETYKN